MLDQFGLTLKAFVNTGGGLYAETENPSGAANAPAPFGWLQTVFPGLQVVQANGGTVGLTVTPPDRRSSPRRRLPTSPVRNGITISPATSPGSG